MWLSLLSLLECPIDHGVLELSASSAKSEWIEDGELRCCRCLSQFVIRRGIPIFLAAKSLTDVQAVEVRERDVGYTVVDPDRLEPGRLPEMDTFRSALNHYRLGQILDAGCGAGPITRIVAGAERVVAMDFSVEALIRFNTSGYRSLDLLNGDVSRLPFRNGSFDLVMSSQVLEHLPTIDLRRQFICELSRVLRAGGRMLLSVYNWSANYQSLGVAKEGCHDNGIFYHRYTPEELRAEVSGYFGIQEICGVRSVLPGTYRLTRMLGRGIVYWDRFLRRTSYSLKYGSYLFIEARKLGGHCEN